MCFHISDFYTIHNSKKNIKFPSNDKGNIQKAVDNLFDKGERDLWRPPYPQPVGPFHLPMTHQAQIPGRSLQVNSLHAFDIHILLFWQ
jgi:hypothetical protein